MGTNRSARSKLGAFRASFTLVELLVVIAIIAVLAMLLFPALGRARAQAQGAQCTSNLRQMAAAFISYESDNNQMPFLNSGYYTNVYDISNNLVSKFVGRDWDTILRAGEYLPNAPTSGVMRCPAALSLEVTNSSRGGYGVSANIFRNEENVSNTVQHALTTGHVPRPPATWLVGDCAQPWPGVFPGSAPYKHVATSFGRPAQRGLWIYMAATPPSQPALRHNQLCRWAAFDGHVAQLTWDDMVNETDNFTGRGESF